MVRDATESEAALVEAAAAGDAQAFAALYDQHVERIYRHVYYRVGHRPEAEDLTQQVFLRAWQAMRRYRPTAAPFIAWLLTIAHNLLVNFYRQRRDTKPLELEPAVRALWADPEAEALARHDRLAAQTAILCLKPDHQQVISLRFLEGFSTAEVASALGKTEGHIRVLQHRALAELRRILAAEAA